jgi:hypothetical protein
MAKKKDTGRKSGLAVEGEILPTLKADWSEWAKDTPTEKWTRGPVLPVNGEARIPQNGKRGRRGRKKRA